MFMIVLLMSTSNRGVIRFWRTPCLVVSGLLALFGGKLMATFGLGVEAFNTAGLSDNPGSSWQEARDATWDWSRYGGWFFWLFLANFIVDFIIWRSEKKKTNA